MERENINYRHFPRLTQPRRDLIMRFKEFVESIDRPDLYGIPGEGKWVEELYNYVHQKNSSITIHDVVRWMSTPWGIHMMKKDNKKTGDHRPLAGRESQKVVHTNRNVTGPVSGGQVKIAKQGSGKNMGALSKPKPKPKPNPKQKPRPTPKSNQSFYNKAPNNANSDYNRIHDRNDREANSQATIPPNVNSVTTTTLEDTPWSSCSTPSSLSSMTSSSSSSSSSSQSGSSSYSDDEDENRRNVENCHNAVESHNRNNTNNQVMAPKPKSHPKPIITIPSQLRNQNLVQYYHQQQQQEQYENPTTEINNSPDPEMMMLSNNSAAETDIRSLYQNAFEAIEIIHDACTKIEAIQSCLIPLEEISKVIHRTHHKLIFPRRYTQVVTTASVRNQVLPIIKIEPSMMQMPAVSSYSTTNTNANYYAGAGGGLGGLQLQQQQQPQQEIENPFQNFESSTQSNFRLLSSSQMSSSSTVRHTLSSRNARGTLAASALTTAVSAGSASAAAAGAGGLNIEIDDEVNILGSVIRTSSTGLWTTTAATGQVPGAILSNESCNNFHPFIIGN